MCPNLPSVCLNEGASWITLAWAHESESAKESQPKCYLAASEGRLDKGMNEIPPAHCMAGVPPQLQLSRTRLCEQKDHSAFCKWNGCCFFFFGHICGKAERTWQMHQQLCPELVTDAVSTERSSGTDKAGWACSASQTWVSASKQRFPGQLFSNGGHSGFKCSSPMELAGCV